MEDVEKLNQNKFIMIVLLSSLDEKELNDIANICPQIKKIISLLT